MHKRKRLKPRDAPPLPLKWRGIRGLKPPNSMKFQSAPLVTRGRKPRGPGIPAQGDELPRRPADAAPRGFQSFQSFQSAPLVTRGRKPRGPGIPAQGDLPRKGQPIPPDRGIAERASGPPPRVAAPRHGQAGDLGDRVDRVVNDQARIARQLLQLGGQARAAWRAAREVAGQLQQVNRNALKR